MTYNEKKKIIERNRGRIYAGFDVHGMLRYVPVSSNIEDIPDTVREGFHPNHDRALSRLSNLTKEYLKSMIDRDYGLLAENNLGVKI